MMISNLSEVFNMDLNQKAAYIKGLLDGLKLDENKDETKVLSAMSDLLNDITEQITCLQDETDELYDFTNELDESLAEIEKDFYDDENDLFEAECPKCGYTFLIDDYTLSKDEIICPDCGQSLALEIDKCDCCDCCCEDDNSGKVSD